MAWKRVNYSRSKIKRAGRNIIKDNIDNESREEALNIIDNWRASHAYPLYVISNKLKRMLPNGSNIFIVHRLKRLDSIIAKLKRETHMCLFEMQDIGGCRVVVDELSDVYRIADKYENSRIRHRLVREYDYIKNPKGSGYRSLHRVYKYKCDNELSTYNNMYVEIQFRTKLQHLWATAVETMGIYTKTSLKSGEGSVCFLRFFSLVSSLFALEERTPTIPNTSENYSEIVNEIKQIEIEHNVLKILSAIKVALNLTKIEQRNKGYYVLLLNYQTRRLRIKYYKTTDIEAATKAYENIEHKNNQGQLDVVLVSASSFDDLKKAYPNYFADINEFNQKLNQMMEF